MSYQEYLKSEHWQYVRSIAIERANGKCQLCSSVDGLNVHHNTYDRVGAEMLADVVVLCSECHGLHHGPEPAEVDDSEPVDGDMWPVVTMSDGTKMQGPIDAS